MKRVRHVACLSALAAAVLTIAAPLIAQTDDLTRIRADLGEIYTARIAAVIESGVDDGLPRELLVDKATEGVAKGMEPDVVLAAVRVFADELRAATAVVGRGADPVAMEKAADALRRGVDRAFLTSLNRDRPDDFAILVVALADLLDTGVEQQLAEDMIRYAASQGLDVDEVLAIPANVKRLVRQGRTPLQAASSVSEGLRAGGGVVPPFEIRSTPGRRDRPGRRPPPFDES